MLSQLCSFGGNLLFKADVYIVRIDPGLFPSIKKKLVEDSARYIHSLKQHLEDRTQIDIPVPCALEGISAISGEDDCIRLMQLLKRHDSKRVKEIVSQRFKDFLKEYPQYSSVPKNTAKQITAEVRKDEIEDQVPKIIEMILMFYSNDIIMHSNSNIALFKPYLANAAGSPIIFFAAFSGVDPEIWDELLTKTTLGESDGTKVVFEKQVNGCDVVLFNNSNNRIRLSSKRQLTPAIIYNTWLEASKLVKDNCDEVLDDNN